MKKRLQITDLMRLTWLITSLVLAPMAARGDTNTVLSLCLDTKLTPEDRLAGLQQDGWRNTGGAADALATALTLTRLSAGRPEDWAQIHSQSLRSAAATSDGTDGFLTSPDGQDAVFITRDRVGLQTCLYLGGTLDMAPLAIALDGSILRTIGEVTRIRGDGVKSLISAHGMTEAGRDMFKPRLPYAMTFTVVLDRQPSDPN